MKQQRLDFLRNMEIFEGWSEQRFQDLNSFMTNQTYNMGEEIYKAGEPPTYLYFLMKGAVSQNALLTLSDVNKYPTTKKHHWESLTTERDVQFEVRRISESEIFGH